MAWAEMRLCLALHVNLLTGGRVIEAARMGSDGSCAYTALLIVCVSSFLVINGTAPGVLLRVWRPCIRGVFLRWRFDVGFRDFMMGGAFVIRSIVVIGVSSITLCCRSLSSVLTLCSLSIVACGFNMLVIFACRVFMHARPRGVVAAILVSSVSSSVNARRCWRFVKFGS